MRSYECTVALHPELGEAGVKEQVGRIQEIISTNGGDVKQTVEWGLRDLAYPIKKERRAVFHVLVFEGDGATVAELERNMRISDHVLRYITVRIDPDRPPVDLGRARREIEGGDSSESSGSSDAEARTDASSADAAS